MVLFNSFMQCNACFCQKNNFDSRRAANLKKHQTGCALVRKSWDAYRFLCKTPIFWLQWTVQTAGDWECVGRVGQDGEGGGGGQEANQSSKRVAGRQEEDGQEGEEELLVQGWRIFNSNILSLHSQRRAGSKVEANRGTRSWDQGLEVQSGGKSRTASSLSSLPQSLGRPMRGPEMCYTHNGRQRQLQQTRVHLQGAVLGLQGQGARPSSWSRGTGWRKTRPRRGWCPLCLPLSWAIRLLCQNKGPGPRAGHESQEADQRHGETQHPLPSWQAGGLPDVGGVTPQRPHQQAVQGGGWHHRRRSRHPSQQQGGVPARSRPKHQGTKRVREIVLQTQVGHWDSSFDAPWGSGGPQWGIGIRPLMSPGDL